MMEELDYWEIEKKLSPFYGSKIGRLYLRICHHFGYKLNIWQNEELTLRLPTHYKDNDHYLFDTTPSWIKKDVIEQVNIELETNKELEFKCRNAGFIRTIWHENDWTTSQIFMYQDGKIFDNKESYQRNSKINKILE